MAWAVLWAPLAFAALAVLSLTVGIISLKWGRAKDRWLDNV